MEQEILTKQPSKILDNWPKLTQFVQILEPEIKQLEEITYLQKDYNLLLIMQFQGNFAKLNEQYYDDVEKYKKLAGIPTDDQKKPKPSSGECVWCMCDVDPMEGKALECGHVQCATCWKEYLEQEFAKCNPFPVCLDESCNLKVIQSFIQEIANVTNDQVLMNRYNKCLGKKFVQLTNKGVACSNSSCEYVYRPQNQFFHESLVYDLQCPAGHQFCYNCGFEPHRPLKCDLLNKWNEKAGDGSMLDAFMKNNPTFFRCPKCSRVINYTQGCDQMTCGGVSGHNDLVKGQGCGHVFCWRCHEPWSDHKGGWSGCNKFKPKGQTQDDIDNEKYMHYLQGYEDNRSMKMARAEDLKKKIETDDEGSYKKQFEVIGVASTQYQFVIDAIQFLIEARRTLKWTYVFGYYVVTNEKRDLFEHQQGLYEEKLMQLQTLLQDDLKDCLFSKDKQNYEKEKKFHQTLKQEIQSVKKTSETYRENLLTSLEQEIVLAGENLSKQASKQSDNCNGYSDDEDDEDNYSYDD